MYRALEAGLVQMAGVEEGSREELLRRVGCITDRINPRSMTKTVTTT